MQGKKHLPQKLFVSFQLANKVPEDNFYRRLADELDLSFLYGETKRYYGSEGQKSIDPIVFFKLILVGYLENLNSDRRIIAHASMRLDILYFIGYDIDEALPWHSTLSRSRQLYGEEVFLSLFKKVLSLCVSKGMVSGKRQAVDSAFVKANASLDSLVEKEILYDAGVYATELAANDEDKKTVSFSKKRQIATRHAWQSDNYTNPGSDASKDRVDEDGQPIRPKFLSNDTHYSVTDPDARISVKPGKARQLNYSAQTSVDTAHHVITNIMADYSDKRDSQSLAAIVKQTKKHLEENGLQMEELLADTGYSSGKALQVLEDNNITGYIPNHGRYKAEREGFTYHGQGDYYQCHQGVRLPFKYATKAYKYTSATKVYSSSAKDCARCPFKPYCIGAKYSFKQISVTTDKALYDKMHERMQSAKARVMSKKRSSTVEPVLGTLLNFMGMRRVWTRGIKAANKFMIGAAIAYNLKKWLNYKAVTVKAQAKSMQKAIGGHYYAIIAYTASGAKLEFL
jgi:transposase